MIVYELDYLVSCIIANALVQSNKSLELKCVYVHLSDCLSTLSFAHEQGGSAQLCACPVHATIPPVVHSAALYRYRELYLMARYHCPLDLITIRLDRLALTLDYWLIN